MTDRHAGYLVVLEENTREDDAQPTLDAIRQIKGVVSVVPVVSTVELSLAEQRVNFRWFQDLQHLMKGRLAG